MGEGIASRAERRRLAGLSGARARALAASAGPMRMRPMRMSRPALARWRERDLRSRYGISVADFWALFDEQRGACAICREPFGERTPEMDHSHVTGRIRGLLCRGCNRQLGLIERDMPCGRSAEWKAAARSYLLYSYPQATRGCVARQKLEPALPQRGRDIPRTCGEPGDNS